MKRTRVVPASAVQRIFQVQNNYKTLKRWTIKTNVFDFDYIMLPINEEIHW